MELFNTTNDGLFCLFIRDIPDQFLVHDNATLIAALGEAEKGFTVLGPDGEYAASAEDAAVPVKEEFG